MKDELGVFFSGLCVIHCFVVTLIILLGGVDYFTILVSTEYLVHPILLMIVVVIGMFSFPSAYKAHRNKLPIILGVVGSLILFFALFSSDIFETLFTVIGGITLINAHLWNYKLSHSD